MSISIQRTHHGKTKYINGNFYSKKNGTNFPYKSSYELAYLQKLEEDVKVIRYMYEPFELGYVDMYNKNRKYIPDFMVLYSDSSVLITEIKPEAMLKDYDVQAKAKAAKAFIKDNYPDINIAYKFITEKDLFKNITEYTNFVRSVKNGEKS